MDSSEEEDSAERTVDEETERILQEAKVVARWKKKPFYIS